ncbi:hypothetical protein D2T29_12865 [Sinirhodobacter populi]|uniref:Type IV conjugative transfer system protein TraL n=1 Tax=Paenirhodobacter populi TaxID=2306993 RepID=A0A443KCL8_9RHOB|nr:type IV conjugative transfer system protein TraL [Sinirhodobacter populi]RWR30557.1 hypothetical protein D2T29_12865 [Sinirhodobacter populi]
MEEVKEVRIPQTLDLPPLVLIFNASHLFSFVGFAMVGVVVGHAVIGGVLGLFFGSFINKYNDKKPDGYIRHMGYFFGFPVMAGKKYTNGLDRDLRP